MRWKSLAYVSLGLTKSALVSELSWTWIGSMLQPNRGYSTEEKRGALYDLTFEFVAAVVLISPRDNACNDGETAGR